MYYTVLKMNAQYTSLFLDDERTGGIDRRLIKTLDRKASCAKTVYYCCDHFKTRNQEAEDHIGPQM